MSQQSDKKIASNTFFMNFMAEAAGNGINKILKKTFHISLHILVGKMNSSEQSSIYVDLNFTFFPLQRRTKRNKQKTFVDRKGHHINHAEL